MQTPASISLERTTPARAGAGERVSGAIVSIACLVVLGLAAWLDPSPIGHGTHTQLGLPPCSWAMWLGRPCPTCGMTTAFALAGEGRWLDSLVTQPAGMALCLGASVAFWVGGYTAVTGSRIGPMVGWIVRPRTLSALGAGLVAAWVYKIITWNGA